MAVLTAAVGTGRHKGDPKIDPVPCAAAGTFYEGGHYVTDATSGQLNLPSAVAAGDKYAGVCAETITTTAAGQTVKMSKGGWHTAAIGSAAQGDVGDTLYLDVSAQSDNPADLVRSGSAETGDILVGEVKEFLSDDSAVYVDIEVVAARTVVA